MRQHELFKSIYESNLKSRAVNVMSCLITYMNTKDNTCFPSIKTIAKCCSISVNTVKRALADLESAGFVEKEARFIDTKNGAQTSNLYRLSAVFAESEPPTEDSLAPDNNDKEYKIITFEDLKDEPTAAEKSVDTPVITDDDKPVAVIPAVSKGITKIRQTVNIISANIKKAVPNTQLSLVPP